MKIFDISVPLSTEMPIWPGNPPFEMEAAKSMQRGDASNVSRVRMGTHTGTHVDAPRHFIEGAPSVDQLPLDQLIGPARVIFSDARVISRTWLETIDLVGVKRLLFKTKNSDFWKSNAFHEDFSYLDREAADYLSQLGVFLVGIDYLSIDRFGDKSAPAHHALLGRGIASLEGLDLSEIEPGNYQLICLPLKIAGADASPARVVLLKE